MVTTNHAIVANQLQVVASDTTDVLHDVTIGHSLGDHGASLILKSARNFSEIENVGMG